MAVHAIAVENFLSKGLPVAKVTKGKNNELIRMPVLFVSILRMDVVQEFAWHHLKQEAIWGCVLLILYLCSMVFSAGRN